MKTYQDIILEETATEQSSGKSDLQASRACTGISRLPDDSSV
jgi:hypothetical protein